MGSAVRRMMVLLAALAVAASAMVAPAQARTQGLAAAAPPERALSWMSAGDSYSSGEGVVGNKGVCAQSEFAYGPLAKERLGKGWKFSSETFTACTSHLVGDFLSARAGTGKNSLWDWGQLEQGGPARVDILTMSFGGNDIGFSSIIYSCLGIRPAFSELINPLCDDLPQLIARVDAMLDPTSDGGSPECTKATEPSTVRASFGCPFKLPGRAKGGSIIDFYYDVVTKKLTSTGQLYVVGYPQLIAPVDQWASWLKGSCKGIPRAFVPTLRELGDHLNTKLKEAVRRTNQALGSERVIYIDRAAMFAKGGHELCGTGEDWLNGPAFDRGEGQVRIEQSFHPNAAGHDTVATELAKVIDAKFPRTPAGVAVPGTPACIDEGAATNVIRETRPPNNKAGSIRCEGGWATVEELEDTADGLSFVGWVLFRRDGGSWTIETSNESTADFCSSAKAAGAPAGILTGCNTPDNSSTGSLVAFESPSGNIRCNLTSTQARCEISEVSWTAPAPTEPCDLDYGQTVALGPEGAPSFLCHGDTVMPPTRTLDYGETVSAGSMSCASEPSGVTCTSASGLRFRLAKGSFEI